MALLGYATALAAMAIDQLSKVWAEATLAIGERHPVLGDMLAMQLAYNPGAAFSLGASATPFITVLAAAGTMFAAWLTWRTTSWPRGARICCYRHLRPHRPRLPQSDDSGRSVGW
ncbi:signal peptidase II [Agrococcus sp. ProA11]|uniref:signal peptidase II n=1 Tax=Agrococcus chionoecetis TaxID=3153752 RepID=UPI0032614A26